MKQGIILMLLIMIYNAVVGQTDTVIIKKKDSIEIGNIIIINQGGNVSRANGDDTSENHHIRRERRRNYSSNDLVFDLGFANFDDQTNFNSAAVQDYVISKNTANPLNSHDFKLKQFKSSNINIWFFMQRMNLIKHLVNLKYGIGLELNNYRFENPVSFRENGTNPYNAAQKINHSYSFLDSISFKKNKLSLDYITVPLMINFQSNGNYSDKGISLSAGVSIGYLYNSRTKQLSDSRGREHIKGDFDNRKFKFSYIGELGLGRVRLYGSYSPLSVFSNGLDLKPYTIGIRFSRW